MNRPKPSFHLFFYAIALLSCHNIQAGLLSASFLRIANQTPQSVYCSFYYQRGTTLTRASQPCLLPAENAIQLELPPSRFLSTRTLALSYDKHMPISATTQYPFLTNPQRVGLWEPDDITLHVNQITNKTILTSTADWRSHMADWHQYQTHINQFIQAQAAALVSTTPPASQIAFQEQRDLITQHAQEALLQKKLSRPLRIGICSSGGGFRAMIATLGLLSGLEQIDMLATVRAISCLSGSTWAVLPWILSMESAVEYTNSIPPNLTHGLMHHLHQQYKDLSVIKKNKELCSLSVSAIDLYGIGLSYTLLKPIYPDHSTLTLDQLTDYLDPSQHPYPLCTAVTRHTPEHPYSWLTFSPFSICQTTDSLYIDTWALSRSFTNGSSTNSTPPPLLGYCMGMFGSSFSVSVRDALERAPESIQRIAQAILPTSWHEQLTQAGWANAKLTAAYLPNFGYGMEQATNKDEEWLCIVDGGYLNNLPIVPLVSQYEEPFDLIIMLDSRREREHRLQTVNKAYQACIEGGYRIAPLNTHEIVGNTITYHAAGTEHDTGIIYLTMEPDKAFDASFNPARDRTYATPNLFYSIADSSRLLSFCTHQVTHYRDLFMQALHEASEGALASL